MPWWSRVLVRGLAAEAPAEAEHLVSELLTLLVVHELVSEALHRELAKLAGVSPQTVLNLEHGKGEQAQRRTIRKLAQALGVKPQELVKPEE